MGLKNITIPRVAVKLELRFEWFAEFLLVLNSCINPSGSD